jgi:GNAT superfamily N-acetyltransferase
MRRSDFADLPHLPSDGYPPSKPPAFIGGIIGAVPIVRDAAPDDAESIGEAHAEAWRIGYDGLFPPAVLEAAVDIRRRMWVGLVGDPGLGGTLLVEEEAGEVVGFIHFGPTSAKPEIAEIYGLYVLPSSWGTGSAQTLMDRAVASLAESFAVAILWTHSEAGRARRFYSTSRWAETGSHRQEKTWDGLVFPAVEYERVLVSS